MVGCKDDFVAFAGNQLEELESAGMAEPRFCQRAVGGVGGGELANHAALGSRMAHHVDEVEDYDVEVVVLEIREFAQQFFSGGVVVDFIIGESDLTAVALELSGYQGRFVEIFAFFAVFVDPQFGEEARYFGRHEPREDGVAGILSRRRKYGAVEAFVDIEGVGYERLDYLPLIEAEVVDQYKEDLLAVVEGGEYAVLEYVGTHERPVGGVLVFDPSGIVLADEFGEGCVGLDFLHIEKLIHVCVGRGELEIPENEFAVKLYPV